MRRTGTISLVVSLAVHGVLLAAVVFCVAPVRFTPPKVHLVYGEVGSESSRGEIWKSGKENAPQIQMEREAEAGASTDAIDSQLMGGSVSKLGDAAKVVATPCHATTNGDVLRRRRPGGLHASTASISMP